MAALAIGVGLAFGTTSFFSRSCFSLAGASPTLGLIVVDEGAVRTGAPPLVVDDIVLAFTGVCAAAGAGARAFEADAAVGFDKRSSAALACAEVVAFRAGVGTGGAAFLAFANDAAVGAYRPEDGVFGLVIIILGVFARDGVEVPARDFARTVDVFDVVDCPVSCGFRGFAAGGLLSRPAAAGGGDFRVDVLTGFFVGVVGMFLEANGLVGWRVFEGNTGGGASTLAGESG